jgi:hypothetical protein
MLAASEIQFSQIVDGFLIDLASGIVGAALPADTGSLIGDYFLKLGGDIYFSVAKKTSVNDTIVSATEASVAFIAGKAVDKYLPVLNGAGGDIADLSRTTIDAILAQDNGTVSWSLAGPTSKNSPLIVSGLVPMTTIRAKMFYNPWNHFTTAIIAATCQWPNRTARNLYVLTYPVNKLGPATAVLSGTIGPDNVRFVGHF